MRNLIIFNAGIILLIIVPIILCASQNTKYVFKYVDYFTDDSYCAVGITSFQELIDTISYILDVLSWITAALMIFIEIIAVFESVIVTHSQIVNHSDAMEILAVCLSVASFEVIVASINFIGAFIWHQSHKSDASVSRR